MIKATRDGVPAGPWTALFPGQLPDFPIPIPAEPVPDGGFTIDGHPLTARRRTLSDVGRRWEERTYSVQVEVAKSRPSRLRKPDRQNVVVAGASSAGDAEVGEQGHHFQA